jgi:hypothetical protein
MLPDASAPRRSVMLRASVVWRWIVGSVVLAMCVGLATMQATAQPLQGWAPPSASGCPTPDEWIELAVPPGTQHFPEGRVFGIRSVAVRDAVVPEVYLAGYQGAFTSRGCELAWVSILDEAKLRPQRIGRTLGVVAVGGSSHVYLGSGGVDPVLVSDDNGATWTNAASRTSGPRPRLPAHSMIIAATASSDAVAYARLHPGTMHGHSGLARTTDGGLNWDVLAQIPGGLLLADPDDHQVISTIGGPCNWCRSANGGVTFTEVAPTVVWPADPTAVGTQRSGGRIWVALQDRTLWVSRDKGQTWSSTTAPPDDRAVLSVAAEAGDDGRLFVVTEAGRLWVRRAGAS